MNINKIKLEISRLSQEHKATGDDLGDLKNACLI